MDDKPKTVKIRKSQRKGKKYVAHFTFNSGLEKKVHFGAAGMSDYTKHRDDKRKLLYLARHRAREDWMNPTSAGALSRWILWNKKTLRESITDYKARFNLI